MLCSSWTSKSVREGLRDTVAILWRIVGKMACDVAVTVSLSDAVPGPEGTKLLGGPL